MRDGPLERNRPGGTIPAARPPGRRRLTRAPGRPADKERIPGGSNIEIKGSVALVAGANRGIGRALLGGGAAKVYVSGMCCCSVSPAAC
jgi:hypothetical protein